MVLCVMEFACAGMWVKAGALGRALTLSPVGADPEVVVQLPEHDQSFCESLDGHWALRGRQVVIEGGLVAAEVEIVRVEVTFAESLMLEPDSPPTEQTIARATEIGKVAEYLANQGLAKLLDHLRARGQFWLGLSMQAPDLLNGPEIYDDSPARRHILGNATLRPIIVGASDEAVDHLQLDLAAAAVAADESPAIEDRILADARNLAMFGSAETLRHAVLLAAMASELRIKATLREVAKPDQAGLVELLFESPRDFSMAISGLLNKPFKLITGACLKDDSPGLWKRVERLFTTRNKIVHAGRIFSIAELQDAIKAANELAVYLESFRNAAAERRALASSGMTSTSLDGSAT